VLVFVVCALRQ